MGVSWGHPPAAGPTITTRRARPSPGTHAPARRASDALTQARRRKAGTLLRVDRFFTPASPIETVAHFAATVRLNETTEGILLDFKLRLERNDAVAMDTANDLASFANSWGGSLLLGIAETLLPDGTKVATAMPGVSDFDRTRDWLEQAVRARLAPNTLPFNTAAISQPGGQPVMVVNVPPLPRGLAASWDTRRIAYPARTSHGKRYLSPMEVEMRLAEPSRAMFLRLHELRGRLARAGGRDPRNLPVVVTSRVENNGRGVDDLCITDLRDSEFILKAGNTELPIPYELVEAAWETTNSRIGLSINATIIMTQAPQNTLAMRSWRPG